jgi:hypothetical protein
MSMDELTAAAAQISKDIEEILQKIVPVEVNAETIWDVLSDYYQHMRESDGFTHRIEMAGIKRDYAQKMLNSCCVQIKSLEKKMKESLITKERHRIELAQLEKDRTRLMYECERHTETREQLILQSKIQWRRTIMYPHEYIETILAAQLKDKLEYNKRLHDAIMCMLAPVLKNQSTTKK